MGKIPSLALTWPVVFMTVSSNERQLELLWLGKVGKLEPAVGIELNEPNQCFDNSFFLK
jgi:hypothetical protein